MTSRSTLAADAALLLRREVGQLRQRETRRVFDLAVYVGTLGGPRDSFVVRARDLPAMDQGLRADVVSELLEGSIEDRRTAWIVRLRVAFAMHGRPLDAFYAITRYGWRDVCSGRSRTWKRLRL